MIGLKILGINRSRAAMTAGVAAAKLGLFNAMQDGGNLIVRRAQEHYFEGQRTAAILKGRPVTSPPGKLGILTGTYRKAITSKTKRVVRGIETVIGLAQGLPYPPVHEFGSSKLGIPARPVFGPAFDDEQDNILGLVRKVTRKFQV